MILGIDEAGRGPWAGPLVVGAVILGGASVDGVTDSKKLTKKKRETLYSSIVESALAHATGWVSATELDALGMSEALRLGTRRAVEQISAPYSQIIIDGTVNFLSNTGKGRYVQVMAKADLLIPSVSAASIIAKVERDRYMAGLDVAYPGYGFKDHAGYGVAKHREAIAKLGVTPEHRLSFSPLAQYRRAAGFSPPEAATSRPQSRTTRHIGNDGEEAAAQELIRRGHSILERNWRTKMCEIDIVSSKDDAVFFVEVKYRKNDTAGDGVAYITAKKLRQMQFAAKVYAHSRRLRDIDLRLAVVSVSGNPPQVDEYIEVN